MGFLRLILSLIVTASHLGPTDSTISKLGLASFSVWLFYLLAGYFAVLQTQRKNTRWEFLFNKVLRIYPAYWVTLGLTLLWMNIYGTVEFFTDWISDPAKGDRIRDWLLLIKLDGILYGVPVHVAWTLTVMLFWWVAIAFGLFDNRRQAFILLTVSIVTQQIFNPSYMSFQWAAVPFALGAALYWIGVRVERETGLCAIAGTLSYPIYLAHYPVGSIIGYYSGIDRSWELVRVAIVPIILTAFLLLLVDYPVNYSRKRLSKILFS